MNISVRLLTFYNKSVIWNGNDDGDDGDVVDDLEAVIMISHVFDSADDAASLTHLINITRMMIIMMILHIDDEGDNPEEEDDDNNGNHEDNAFRKDVHNFFTFCQNSWFRIQLENVNRGWTKLWSRSAWLFARHSLLTTSCSPLPSRLVVIPSTLS